MGEETLQPAHPHPFLLQLQVSRKEGGREGEGRRGGEERGVYMAGQSSHRFKRNGLKE